MTLYVWSGEGVLENYRSGFCIVLANNLEEARSLAFDQILILKADLFDDPSAFFTEEEEELLDKYTGFLSNEPKVYTSPVAFAIEGSE